MEDLVSGSSVRSVLSCSSSEEQSQAQPEESTWTDYFVDFMMSEEKKRQDDDSYCTHGGGGVYGDCSDQKVEEEEGEEDSMISDAASCAPAAALPDRYKELKKLKKKVFKALDHDDSLKDTASSPVNSPKEVGIGDDHGREGMDYADAMVEGMRFVDQSQKSITPCAELKNKGLCLFPLSMLLHYHG